MTVCNPYHYDITKQCFSEDISPKILLAWTSTSTVSRDYSFRMLLFIIFTTVSRAVAVHWTSTSTFPNGSLVQACVGDNISLPWDFNRMSTQRISIEWLKDAGKRSLLPTNQKQPHPTTNLCSNDSACTDQEETILAYYVRGVFTPFSSPHIDFLPNAGIILSMATLSDTGYYRVELNVRGDPQSYVQGAFVHVSEGPVTIDGGLHAYILPKSVYQETTGQWHLQIGCGTFLSLGQPSVSVKWNTPSREILNSTSYDNGVFILTVSNPVKDGEYSCFLERISPAVVCLHNKSSMNRAATVDVKGIHTRISVLEGGLEALREETVNLTTENKQLRQEVQRLESVDRNITDLLQANNRNITGMVHDFISHIKDYTEKPTSCEDVKNYDKSSGIHRLFLGDSRTLNVYCDQSTDNGGWVVIQRRQDGSVNFYRDWNQYEVGFGNMNTEFWIGLANLHQLTKSKTVKLRVDLTDFNGSTAYAVYNKFSISDADDKYRLHVGGYNGTAGDSLANHNKMKFSTFDRDHDTESGNCAQTYHGAWWYVNCHNSNLNGRYKSDGASGPDGVNWYTWRLNRSFKRVEMKIK